MKPSTLPWRWPWIAVAAALISMNATAVGTPENATSKRYGDRWACNPGYYEQSGECAEILIPANAHLNYGGNGWVCDRPFRNREGQCLTP
jgi:hypothetical protein